MRKQTPSVFRLRSTEKQERLLQGQLDDYRWLYNQLFTAMQAFLDEELGPSLTLKYAQEAFISPMKKEKSSLPSVYPRVVQNVRDRLDKFVDALSRRAQAGGKARFPLFCSHHRYDSLCYSQSGFSFTGKHVKLSKVGKIPPVLHRFISEKIKTCTIKHVPSNAWESASSCEVETQPFPRADVQLVGIYLRIENITERRALV